MDIGAMAVIFLFGLMIGSFLNVCIHRLPREQSIIWPSSRCPRCKIPIPFWGNIPIVGFLLLRGRCHACRERISWRYPAVELLNAFGYLLIVSAFGYTLSAAVYALLFSSLLVVTFIDFEHQIIPNEITLPGMVVGLLAASTILPAGFVSSIAGLFVGGGLFCLAALLSQWILKRDGMGVGDIKLIAMIGAFLGWRGMLLTIFLGALAGTLFGLFQILFMGRKREDTIPFGPFLALGAFISLLFQTDIILWYLRLGRP
jgi:leader peptidase (prepilin peptidase)/N-methyltransferase